MRRVAAIRARLRAADPADMARVGAATREPWAGELLEAIMATGMPAAAPAAGRRRGHLRTAIVAVALLAGGGALAVAAVTGTFPRLLSGHVPATNGGLPTKLKVIPATVSNPVGVATASVAADLWTGRTVAGVQLADLVAQPAVSPTTESVGTCPAAGAGVAVTVCVASRRPDAVAVAGRTGPGTARVELVTGSRTRTAVMRDGYFLVVGDNGARLEDARIVALDRAGATIASRPALPRPG